MAVEEVSQTRKDASGAGAAESAGGTDSKVLDNGLKLVGETIIPGASLLLDGKMGPAALHAAAGIAGRIILGPPGWILAAANSYSKSCTNKNLYEQFVKRDDGKRDSGKAA